MNAEAITRAEALFALATAPFVVACIVAITVAVCWALWHESRPSDYLAPWNDRPGERR